jgi:hypothetical protein
LQGKQPEFGELGAQGGWRREMDSVNAERAGSVQIRGDIVNIDGAFRIELIRSTRASVDRQDHGRESCVSRHARAGPLARRAGTLARAHALPEVTYAFLIRSATHSEISG